LSLPPLPSLDEIKEADEEFWRWVFREDDDDKHPLKVSGDMAQIQSGRVLVLAGALSDEPEPKRRERSLKIPPQGIEYIFVPADNCVYTKADGDGANEQVLINNANRDMASGTGNVSLNGNSLALNLLPGHAFRPELNIQKRIKGSGKSKNGEGWDDNKPPGDTIAASACHYAIIRAGSLRKDDKIIITGEPGTEIDVTYTVFS